MASHSMIALVPLRYGDKRLEPGDAFIAEGAHAKLLVAIKKAKLADEPAKPATPPPPKPAPAPSPAAKSTAVPGMTTRSYKTRDLKPE